MTDAVGRGSRGAEPGLDGPSELVAGRMRCWRPTEKGHRRTLAEVARDLHGSEANLGGLAARRGCSFC